MDDFRHFILPIHPNICIEFLDKNKYQIGYRQEFSSAQIMADFIRDARSVSLYQRRSQKYLE